MMDFMTPKNCHLCYGTHKEKTILKSFSHTDYGHDYCTKCGITFDSNIDEILDEYQGLTNDDVNNLEEDQYRKFFVETSNITDDNEGVYTDFEWDDQDELKSGIANHVLNIIKSKHRSDENISVLDVGCGDGFTTMKLSKAFPNAKFVAVDPSPQVVKVGELESVTAHQGILQNIKFGNNKFDVIVIIGNLMLHADPFDTLLHAKKYLKDDGLLIFDFKNIKSSVRIVARLLGLFGFDFINKRYFIQRNFINMRYGLNRKYMKSFCESIGLEVISSQSKPPRLLEFSNKSSFASGATGMAWKLFNKIDGITDEQAWIQFNCSIKSTN